MRLRHSSCSKDQASENLYVTFIRSAYPADPAPEGTKTQIKTIVMRKKHVFKS